MARKRLILMVGSELRGREHLAALKALGCDVELVDGALDALLALRREKPRLAVVDLALPHAEAWELVRALRLDPVSAGIPVAVVAAGPDEAREALGLGAACAAVRPVTPEGLAKLARRAIGPEISTPPPARRA